MDVSHHVGTGIKPRTSAKAASTLNAEPLLKPLMPCLQSSYTSYCTEISTLEYALRNKRNFLLRCFHQTHWEIVSQSLLWLSSRVYDWVETCRTWQKCPKYIKTWLQIIAQHFPSSLVFSSEMITQNQRMDPTSLDTLPPSSNHLTCLSKSLIV